MTELVVSAEQARLLGATGGVVVIRDQQGNLVGGAYRAAQADPHKVFTPQQIALAKRRAQSQGPRSSP